MHLTLKFLGHTNKLEEIDHILQVVETPLLIL